MNARRCPKYALKVIFEWDETLTYRDGEIMRMSSTDRKWTPIKSTINWHACFGTHSPMGCDGCNHWTLCLHASDERLKARHPKTTYFKGAIIVTEEST